MGLGAAIAVGFLWRLLLVSIPFGFFLNFLLAAGAGWAIAEAVSLAVNRRRGLPLQVIASLGLVLAFLLAMGVLSPAGVLFLLLRAPLSFLALALGILVAVGHLR